MKTIWAILPFLILHFSCQESPKALVLRLEQATETDPSDENKKALAEAYFNAFLANSSTGASKLYLKKAADLFLALGDQDRAISCLQQGLKGQSDLSDLESTVYLLNHILADRMQGTLTPVEKAEMIKAAFPSEPVLFNWMEQQRALLIGEMGKQSQGGFSPDLMLNFANLSELFAYAFPLEDESPSALLNAAQMVNSQRQFDRAVQIYDYIYATYPKHHNSPQALFLKGFTLENDIHDSEEAQKVLMEFLNKYPEDEFADDARFLLESLGRSPEEIIAEFDK